MKNHYNHLIVRMRYLFLIALFGMSALNTYADHFRYGNITWQRVPGQPLQVKFISKMAFKISTFGSAFANSVQIGTQKAVGPFNTGIGSSQTTLTVTSINRTEDWFYGEYSTIVTYPAAGNYYGTYSNCCRIQAKDSLKNNANDSMKVPCLIQVGANNDAPISTVPPFVNFAVNDSFAHYQVPAIDPNGDSLTFSLSPAGTFGSAAEVQPAGLAISPSGLITWNTWGKLPKQLFNVSVRITDSKGAYITLDFLIRIVPNVPPSTIDYTVTPPDGTNFDLQPGDSINFNVKVGDPNSDSVQLTAIGLPPGASFTDTGSNPVNGTFNWKPDSTQQGTYLVNFTSQNDSGVQNNTVITFDVSYKPRFDVPAMPGNNSVFTLKTGDTITHPVIVYHPTVTDAVVLTLNSGLVSGMNFSPAFPLAVHNRDTTQFTWIPTAGQWGIHMVTYKAQDTFYKQIAYDTAFYLVDNAPTVTSTPILYAHVGQLYNYLLTATDADIPSGDKLKIENITKPSFLNTTDNGNATFNIAGIPNTSDIGTYNISIEVADSLNHFGGTHVGFAMQNYTLVVLPELTLTGNPTDATTYGGNDGSINITAGGGRAPYTYAWSNNTTAEDPTGLVAGTYTVVVTDSVGGTITGTYTVNQPINITGTVTNVTIYGGSNGSINITPAGGVGPYTYSWSNSTTAEDPTGLTAGTYTVVVTDSRNQTATVTFTVSQPAQLVVTGTSTDATIYGGNNGSINITATGGVGPYTYHWSNNSTVEDPSGLAAGTYTVTITDANGAQTTGTYTVSQPSKLTVSGIASNVTIYGGNNGSINITPVGAVGPYTYAWSNSTTAEDPSGLAMGTYTVIVTAANGDTTSAVYTISQPSKLTVSGIVTNVTTYGGNNGSINITASGAVGPYTYSWSNSTTAEDPTGLTAGTYTVVVTAANGDTASGIYTVTQPAGAPLTGILSASPVYPVSGQSPYTIYLGYGTQTETLTATASGGQPGYTYSWSPAAGLSATTGASVTAAPDTTTTYTVVITDHNNNTVTLTKTIYVVDVRCSHQHYGQCSTHPGNHNHMISVCHNTSSYYNPTVNICIDIHAVPVHLSNHGDHLGTCLDVSGTVTNVSCYGSGNGSISVNGIGGVPPYTYSWTGGSTAQTRNNLSPGTYTVTVTDALGATSSQVFTVTQPSQISTSASVSNGGCYNNNNGSINLSVSGGTAPYSYSWSNNATSQDIHNLSAGVYSVIVTDAHGCTATRSDTIRQSASLSVTGTVTNVGCNNDNTGAINLSISGGTAPYTYSWNNGCSNSYYNSNHGHYCHNWWNSWCGSHTSNSCSNHSQNLSALEAGTYVVTVTDANGCSQSASFTVTEPSAISASISVNPNPTVSGQASNTIYLGYGSQSVTLSASVSGGTSGYTYSWWPTTGVANPTSASTSVSPTTTTTYTLTVRDAHNCTKSVNVTIYVIDVRGPNNTVKVCHASGSWWNTSYTTMNVSQSAVASHLAHGDNLGSCSNDDDDDHNHHCGNKGITTEITSGELKLYPNPTSGEFVVDLPTTVKGGEAMIMDANGKVVERKVFMPDTKLTFNLNYVAKGTYLVQIVNGTDVYKTRVVIQ